MIRLFLEQRKAFVSDERHTNLPSVGANKIGTYKYPHVIAISAIACRMSSAGFSSSISMGVVGAVDGFVCTLPSVFTDDIKFTR